MSLAFAAITPHPPVLIPAIGKDKVGALEKTKAALEAMEQEMYLAKVDTIFVISPHSGLYEGSFAVNANTTFNCSFEKFGDLTTKKQLQGTPDLAAKISHASRSKDMPIQLTSDETLDHGSSVPLFYLTAHQEHAKVLPIGYSGLNAMEHIRFGELLNDVINESDKRIAVIASGDMSHDIDKPGGDERKAFDEELQRLISERAVGSLMQMEEKAKAADECGYRSILILLGILKNIEYTFTVNAYEHPFGVGYLTGTFSF